MNAATNQQASASDPTRTDAGTVGRAVADPRFDRYRNRRSRRRLSLAHAAATMVVLAALGVATSGALVWWAASAVVALPMLAWVVVTGMLNSSTNGMTELADRNLDEIQRRVRDDGYRRAYTGAIVVVVLLAGMTVFDVFARTPPVVDLLVAMGAFLAVLTLPVHVLAWTLPDPDPDDRMP